LEGRIYKIQEQELRQLATKLGEKYDIYAPVNTHDEAVFSKYRFQKIEGNERVALHYAVTATPPTKYLFPARETILEFEKGKIVKSCPNKRKSIIFGLNIHDLLGINLLDQEFSSPIEDEKYSQNRKGFLLFSIDCFDPPREAVYDIHFKKIDEGVYEALAKSPDGKRIVKENQKLFTKLSKATKKHCKEKTTPLHHPDLPEIVEKSKNDPIWDNLAEICFGCGICTYVCPVCYCFETEDNVKIEGLKDCEGCRLRRWDSCMLPDFASISSHDFRPELRDRIYNWYHHKFVRTPREHGTVGCVDCERCIVYCPARINFHSTLQYLIKKYS